MRERTIVHIHEKDHDLGVIFAAKKAFWRKYPETYVHQRTDTETFMEFPTPEMAEQYGAILDEKGVPYQMITPKGQESILRSRWKRVVLDVEGGLDLVLRILGEYQAEFVGKGGPSSKAHVLVGQGSSVMKFSHPTYAGDMSVRFENAGLNVEIHTPRFYDNREASLTEILVGVPSPQP